MNLIQLENIYKSFGEKPLFNDISLSIHKGDKLALIAPNGSGKSTLLRILTGEEIPDKGNISSKKDLSIGYLRQLTDTTADTSIKDYLYQAGSPIANTILAYNSALSAYEKTHSDQDQHLFQKNAEKMDLLDGWNFERKYFEILERFEISNYNQKIGELSGGQQKKVALAKLLVEEYDLLLLDEPTNHLDIEMIEWLESFLSTSNKSFLTVTHDRNFLDNICNAIIEIDRQQLYHYQGNYAYYIEKKMERESSMQKDVEKNRNLYKKELDWIRRQPKARGTKAKYRVDAFDQIKQKAHTDLSTDAIQIDMQSSRLGKKIIECHNVSFAYKKEKIILKNFDYIFKRKEKLGIVGANGSGKTSFLNLLTGSLLPDNGQIITGETIRFGYYKQNDDILQHGQKRVIDFAKEMAENVSLTKGKTISISQFLQLFLFSPEAQYTPINKLSGGERKRLSLIRVLLNSPNFLILDEPTNDLDIPTIQILESFLSEFDGCLIVVSHDRQFMDRITDHLFIFKGDGIINDYHASYSDYRAYIRTKKHETEKATTPTKQEKKQNKKSDQKQKLSYKEQKELENIENLLPELEKKKDLLTEELNQPNLAFEKLNAISTKIQNLLNEIDEMSMRWLELSEKQE